MAQAFGVRRYGVGKRVTDWNRLLNHTVFFAFGQ